jgi:formylglycine-generating enzyme required for sulfatase activity
VHYSSRQLKEKTVQKLLFSFVSALIMCLLAACGGQTLTESGVNLDLAMVNVKGGTYQMGQTDSATSGHQVSVSSFKMWQTKITLSQYQTVMESNPSHSTGDGNKPVEQVSWYDAVRFCNEMSKMSGLGSCYNLTTFACDLTKNGIRLPTEAEWEYACRGVNVYILDDMNGNVKEWCNDWYGEYSSASQTDPTGPANGSNRIVRGGSSAFRWNEAPDLKSSTLGFRVVRR